MPSTWTHTFPRGPHLALALALAGCLDPALATTEAPTAPEETPADETSRKLRKRGLYVEPVTNASEQADLWAISDPAGAARMEVIADHQIGIWVGDWTSDPAGFVDDAITRAGLKLQTFVVYNIPHRDCGLWSAGGAADAIEYEQFIADVAAGLDGRPAIVVVEPDALATEEDCLTDVEIDERETLISDAVETLTAAGGIVYVDAGDSNWIPSADMADRLDRAGVHNGRGFALNVSHTEYTVDESAYAEEIRAILGTDLRYVVDTSRNGFGPAIDNEWCNPAGRALGDFPTLFPQVLGMDAKLWVKPPGESDGECNGGPSAGTWWPEYADDLAEMAGF